MSSMLRAAHNFAHSIKLKLFQCADERRGVFFGCDPKQALVTVTLISTPLHIAASALILNRASPVMWPSIMIGVFFALGGMLGEYLNGDEVLS